MATLLQFDLQTVVNLLHIADTDIFQSFSVFFITRNFCFSPSKFAIYAVAQTGISTLFRTIINFIPFYFLYVAALCGGTDLLLEQNKWLR